MTVQGRQAFPEKTSAVMASSIAMNEKATSNLLGIGAGLRVRFGEHFSGKVDFGFPIGDKSSEGSGVRVHFQVNLDF